MAMNLLTVLGIFVLIVSSLFYYFFLYFPQRKLIILYTKWGKELNKANVLPEYPRPQFERSSYLNLNGYWEYAIRKDEAKPSKMDGKVLVPFSIESPLSEVQRQLLPGEFLWYRRELNLSNFTMQDLIILHFGAVDQFCEVFINSIKVGEHDGGYIPFEFDITRFAKMHESNILEVKVIDNLTDNGAAYGKQSLKRGQIWYTATSGIWQTVWIESVPKTYIKNIKIIPEFDENSVTFYPEIIGESTIGTITIFDKNHTKVSSGQLHKSKETKLFIPNPKSWYPENPYLYTVEYQYGKDIVKSYFGMRKYSIGIDSKGYKRLFLNNKPYFHKGVLDQGYWPDGLLTAPTDEALKFDIMKIKSLGFNMLRKHIKIEPLRWYYHCDTFGIIVWQDMISGGSPFNPIITQILPLGLGIDYINDKYYSLFGRSNEIGRKNYYRDLEGMINLLFNTPCISTWVPFNEGWGQFDANNVTKFIKKIDSTRYVDQASGWHDQGEGDFKSLHVYFKKIKIQPDKYNRTIVLSEFGGYSLAIEGHMGSPAQFGYMKFKNYQEFNEGYKKLYEEEIIPQIPLGLSATVYTQVSDIEDEINGILTYDRKLSKADPQIFNSINKKLIINQL